ncbi:MAG: hypothetical protein WC856_02250 [Methylococcaceae bacterium]|jgi:hypothetical protein
MKTIKQIRLINLIRLANQRHLIKEFCAEVDLSPAYYSQITHGLKGIGTKVARQIESKLNLEPGYMDIDHDAGSDDSSALAAVINKLPAHLMEQVKGLIYAIYDDAKLRNRRAGDAGRGIEG